MRLFPVVNLSNSVMVCLSMDYVSIYLCMFARKIFLPDLEGKRLGGLR